MDFSREKAMTALARGGYNPEISEGDADRIARGWLAAGQTRRGVMLQGPCGCGKTLAARALKGPCPCSVIYADTPKCVMWIDTGREDARDFDAGGWVLDDLGREAEKSDYGVRRNIVAEFLERQYRAYTRRLWEYPPIITTNLDGDAMRRRYDAHIVSRLVEMFVIVKCQSPDHRLGKTLVIQ